MGAAEDEDSEWEELWVTLQPRMALQARWEKVGSCLSCRVVGAEGCREREWLGIILRGMMNIETSMAAAQ